MAGRPSKRVRAIVLARTKLAEQDLIACETAEAPNALDAIGVWWQRFVGGFSGAPSQAETKIYNVMPIIANNKTNAA